MRLLKKIPKFKSKRLTVHQHDENINELLNKVVEALIHSENYLFNKEPNSTPSASLPQSVLTSDAFECKIKLIKMAKVTQDIMRLLSSNPSQTNS